jgi:hypothetical protein
MRLVWWLTKVRVVSDEAPVRGLADERLLGLDDMSGESRNRIRADPEHTVHLDAYHASHGDDQG